jgi:MFS family permease
MSNKKSIWTWDFIIVAVSNFFIFTVFYALLTLMPIYVLDLPKGTVTQAGLVTTIFLLSVIIVRPFSGVILEMFGKKRMLVISMLAFALSTFSYTLTEDITILLILRFVHGISFSLATTVTLAIVADLVPPERRGEGLGYFGMSMNLAIVAGPFFALILQPIISYRFIFLLFGIIMLIGWLCGLFVKESRKGVRKREKRRLSWSDLFEKKALAISSVGIFVSFSYASIMSFISIYAESIGLIKAASFFFLVFAVAMLISRPFTGRLFDLKGPNIVIIPSLIIYAIGMFVLSFTSSTWMLLLAGGLIGVGYGTLLPCFQTLAIESTSPQRTAYATATFFTLYDTGIAIGSFILGVAANYLGYSNLYMYVGIFILIIVVYYKVIMRQSTT